MKRSSSSSSYYHSDLEEDCIDSHGKYIIPTLKSLVIRTITKYSNYDYIIETFKEMNNRCSEDIMVDMLQSLIKEHKLTDHIFISIIGFFHYHICLDNCSYIRQHSLLYIANASNLRTLSLKNCIQVSNGLVRLILQQCNNLQVLDLEGCYRVTDNAFATTNSLFFPLIASVNLERISFKNCPQITGEFFSSYIKNGCKLIELNISKCRNVKSEEIGLCFHESLNMEVLDVSFSSVNDVIFNDIYSEQTLQILDISRCKITDKSLIKIGKYFPHLKEFYCHFNTDITDKGIKEICKNCKNLTIVELSNCTLLSDDSLNSLKCLSNLTRLDMSYCGNISDMGVVESCSSWINMSEIILTFCKRIKDLSVSYLLQNCQSIALIGITGCPVSDDMRSYLMQNNIKINP